MRFGRLSPRLVALLAVVASCSSINGRTGRHSHGESLEGAWREGRTFDAFLAAADDRRDQWESHYRDGAPADALRERAAAIPGRWNLLVIAEDWCGDSVNTVPYLARLAEAVDGLELRILDSTQGRALMDAHRTPDGRAATPTVLILDETYRETACWVERPAPLREWVAANRKALGGDEYRRRLFDWYAADHGATTLTEVLDRIEATAGGTSRCGS